MQAYENGRAVAARGALRMREASAILMVASLVDEQGRAEEALHSYERASDLFQELGAFQSLALTQMFHAGCVARAGNTERANRLLGAASDFLSPFPMHPWVAVANLQRALVNLAASRTSDLGAERSASSAQEEAVAEWSRWRLCADENESDHDHRFARIYRNHVAARIAWRHLGQALGLESSAVSLWDRRRRQLLPRW